MKKKKWGMLLGLIFLLLLAYTMPALGEDDVPRISTEQLKEMLGSADLILLDGRIAKEWRKSDIKILGAVRADPHDVSSWAGNYSKDQKIVVYCSWKNEYTSASVAGRLIELGYEEVYALKGGWKEWVKKEYPTELK